MKDQKDKQYRFIFTAITANSDHNCTYLNICWLLKELKCIFCSYHF